MKEIVESLIQQKETVATMESCTGGYIAHSITNIEGASSVLRFSAVTYSNEYKMKMGVLKETIDTYSVYSEEVAKEMSYQIHVFANATYGIGVTGKMNRQDPNNERGEENVAYFSIYDSKQDCYYTKKLLLPLESRERCKEFIRQEIETTFLSVLKK